MVPEPSALETRLADDSDPGDEDMWGKDSDFGISDRQFQEVSTAVRASSRSQVDCGFGRHAAPGEEAQARGDPWADFLAGLPFWDHLSACTSPCSAAEVSDCRDTLPMPMSLSRLGSTKTPTAAVSRRASEEVEVSFCSPSRSSRSRTALACDPSPGPVERPEVISKLAVEQKPGQKKCEYFALDDDFEHQQKEPISCRAYVLEDDETVVLKIPEDDWLDESKVAPNSEQLRSERTLSLESDRAEADRKLQWTDESKNDDKAFDLQDLRLHVITEGMAEEPEPESEDCIE
eukprot:TRINITY_DN4467_c0_g1_i1.p1 TRINITY_DN4467_c0_g1~~TRINITY_DN4467_c0_g1_i1.p1  ORF type:complete len:290 (+),score=71.79 TRINITY_DN4467_c0_g1_i1:31-900(+)